MNNCNCAEHNLTNEAFLDLTITQSVKALVEYNFTGLKLDGCECSNGRRWSRDRCRVSDATAAANRRSGQQSEQVGRGDQCERPRRLCRELPLGSDRASRQAAGRLAAGRGP